MFVIVQKKGSYKYRRKKDLTEIYEDNKDEEVVCHFVIENMYLLMKN